MDNKISFIRYLASEHSLDYWSDVGIEHAIELANALLASDWAELHEEWTKLEAIVQARIAEVVSEISSSSTDIVPMLLSMLSSDSTDVVEASLDSLNSICQQSPEQIDMHQLSCALDSLNPTDTVVARVLDSLKQRVKLLR